MLLETHARRLGIACEEIGAADVNLAAAPVTVGLTGAQLAKGGSPSVQRRWLPSISSPWATKTSP